MDLPTKPTDAEVTVIDDALWEALVDLTHGAAMLCYQCGVCTATCPWGLVKRETVSVRTLIRQAQLGIRENSKNLWLCATCSQCEAYCPRGVPIANVFRGLRYLAWERRETPQGLPSLLWSIYWNNNPWSQPPSQRSHWAKDIVVPTYNPSQHEILFYVGCTSSYDTRAQKIAQALVQLLSAAGVSFGTLGDDEPCCGEAALNVGHGPYFQEIVQKTSEIFKEKGIRQLVTISPHCYDVFKNHYLQIDGGFEAQHYTQYLAGLVEQNRLKFESSVELRVAFHDPCYLARHNAETKAPRQVLDAIPGVELVEMTNTGQDTLCCGGGGGRMWLETAVGERFSDLRVQEALATRAQVLATTCPFCIACLEDSVKAEKIQGLEVMDVAEIATLAVAR